MKHELQNKHRLEFIKLRSTIYLKINLNENKYQTFPFMIKVLLKIYKIRSESNAAIAIPCIKIKKTTSDSENPA